LDSPTTLLEVSSVTYPVWKDFKQLVRPRATRESRFDLWLTIDGEFAMLAFVKTKTGETLALHRYIDLPGRPPD
jgi:hypothetical protein